MTVDVNERAGWTSEDWEEHFRKERGPLWLGFLLWVCMFSAMAAVGYVICSLLGGAVVNILIGLALFSGVGKGIIAYAFGRGSR